MVGTLRSSDAWYFSHGNRLIAVRNVTNLLIYIVVTANRGDRTI